jgi:hypothetical protein
MVTGSTASARAAASNEPRKKIAAAGRRVGIEQNPNTFDAGCNLLEEAEPLTAEAGVGVRKSRNVAAGAGDAGDETRAYWIADRHKNDRDDTGLTV